MLIDFKPTLIWIIFWPYFGFSWTKFRIGNAIHWNRICITCACNWSSRPWLENGQNNVREDFVPEDYIKAVANLETRKKELTENLLSQISNDDIEVEVQRIWTMRILRENASQKKTVKLCQNLEKKITSKYNCIFLLSSSLNIKILSLFNFFFNFWYHLIL